MDNVVHIMKVSKDIEQLIPYKPGKSIATTKKEYGLTEVYKLASNESPVGTSPKVMEAIQKELNNLHRYPDPNATKLKELIALQANVSVEQIVVGNGSNELIDLMVRTFCQAGDQILTSEAAFIAYKICAKAAGVKVIETPLTSQMKFDIDAILKKIESDKFKIIFVANPNNPTGTYIPESEIVNLLEVTKDLNDTIVVLDEAYNDFVRVDDFPKSLNLFSKYKNLVILKTLSKVFAIAGLRLGYIIADDQVCNYINRIRNPFNVNSLAQVAAIAALQDKNYLEQAQKVNWDGLDYFYTQLKKIGVTYWPSQANFVLIDTKIDSAQVFEALLRMGVITRPVKAYGLPTHIRISVGKETENKIAMNALEKVLNELSNNN